MDAPVLVEWLLHDPVLAHRYRQGRGRPSHRLHFTGEAQRTHEISDKLVVGGSTYQLAGTHGPSAVSGATSNPKDCIDARLSWSEGPLAVMPSMDCFGHFSVIDPPSTIACRTHFACKASLPW